MVVLVVVALVAVVVVAVENNYQNDHLLANYFNT